MRPRTLSAPLPPPMPPPVPLSGSLHSHDETRSLQDPLFTHGTQPLHEAPTEMLYGFQPPTYEPPPRSSDRLADSPVGGPGAGSAGGPGISAGYRAVSQAADATHPPGARWPAPSPAPPAQAHHGPQGSEHTYAPPQEPPLYASPLYTTSPYGTSEYGTADATPSYSPPTGSVPMPRTPAPSYEPSYGTPYRSAPAAEPSETAVPITPTTGAGAEPPTGPFSAPPAGEPWHAPAGDRP